jgi:hypothetical protein
MDCISDKVVSKDCYMSSEKTDKQGETSDTRGRFGRMGMKSTIQKLAWQPSERHSCHLSLSHITH